MSDAARSYCDVQPQKEIPNLGEPDIPDLQRDERTKTGQISVTSVDGVSNRRWLVYSFVTSEDFSRIVQ